MADTDFSVYATIKANTTQFEQGMNKATNAVKSTNKVVDGLSSKLKSVFGSLGAVFAVSQIKKFSSESVKLWKYQDKQLNILNTTLKTTGADAWTSSKEISSMASSLQDVTNYGDEAILAMQNVLLGFRNIKGDNFEKATKSILDMSTVLGVDLTSASRTVGKALNDPINGVSMLTRYGIRLSDEQKTLIQTLMATGKTAEAQDVILQELNKTYGGTAEATAEAGQQLKNVWGDVKEQIGVAFAGISDRFAIFMKDFLKNLNFEKFYNVMGNTYEMISTKINQLISKFKELKQNIKDFVNSEDFKPFLRLFDTIAGAVKKEIGNINNFIEGFAEGLRSLFSSIDSKKLEKVVNTIVIIIDVVYDVRDEISSVLSELQTVIFTALGNIWTRLKEVFINSNNELANSEGNIHSWGQFIYEELNAVYKVFQDLMLHIKALLSGDWRVAWESAKLATLRVIDTIITGVDTMLSAFPKITKVYTDSINWMIKGVNEVRSWFGEDPFNLIEPYKGSKDPLGVKELIQEAEKELAGLTGQEADHDILDLKGLSEQSEGTIQNIIAQFTKANDILLSQRKERKDYFTQADEEEGDSSKKVVQKTSEWNSKLLSQILDGLNEYDKEYLDVKKQIINAEKEEAIENAKTEADKQKIALYYLGEIENAEEDYHKAVAEKYADDLKIVEETRKQMIAETKEMREKTISVFKDIGSYVNKIYTGISNVVSKVMSSVISVVKSAWSSFTNIVKFNVSDSLDSILAFEDSVLSFFIETLPQLPYYLDSVFQSMETLILTLADTFQSVGFQDLVTNIITSLSEGIANIINLLGQLSENVSLDDFISNLMNSLLTGLKNISESILENLPKILKFIENLISDIADKLPDLLEVLIPTVLKVMTMIFTSVTNILTENVPKIVPVISKLLDENLPDLIKAFVSLVTSIAKMLPQIIIDILPTLIHSVTTLVVSLVEALPEIITTLVNALPDIIDLVIKEIPALVSDVLNAVLKALPELITILLTKLPDIIMSLITGIFNLFKGLIFDVDWAGIGQGIWNSIVAVFSGIGKWFEDLWNVVKVPFVAFGKWCSNLWDGLVSGIKNLWDGLGTFFETIWNNIKKPFKTFGKWFKDLWDGLGKWFSNLWDGMLNVLKAPINLLIKGINFIISGLNKISFTIPDWVPFVGGKKFGIDIPEIQYLAKGTDNARKGLAIVGEAGPELVRFKGGEQVLNNRNTNKALSEMGNKSNVFNVTFNNMQDTTAFAMIQQLKQYNRQLAVNGII